ncbi:hypothetical protein HC891_12195 [Candidatus Gracilibacteria bacterium]|nr:hypothetical protein [Candidatus Gracilibacteria bacterium]
MPAAGSALKRHTVVAQGRVIFLIPHDAAGRGRRDKGRARGRPDGIDGRPPTIRVQVQDMGAVG